MCLSIGESVARVSVRECFLSKCVLSASDSEFYVSIYLLVRMCFVCQ